MNLAGCKQKMAVINEAGYEKGEEMIGGRINRCVCKLSVHQRQRVSLHYENLCISHVIRMSGMYGVAGSLQCTYSDRVLSK